jgi:hypothetical protein
VTLRAGWYDTAAKRLYLTVVGVNSGNTAEATDWQELKVEPPGR